MNIRFLAFALLAVLSISVNAQSSLIFNHYITSDGLSQNTIQCIYQDKKGFIWIGTSSSGLNKFDGYRFLV
jgi:ligand-binding sensor domain-containing protein